MDNRWNKKYDPQTTEDELAKFLPYTDGIVEYLVKTPRGIEIKRVKLTEEEWNATRVSRTLQYLIFS